MENDSLVKIKKAEEKVERDILKLEEDQKEEKEKKATLLDKKIMELKKKHEKRILEIESELSLRFEELNREFQIKREREEKDLKERAKNNFDSFFAQLKER